MEKVIRYFERNGEFVARIVDDNGGRDVFLSSKKLADAMVARFRLRPVMSYTLAGLQKGKKVYRNTYAIRFGDSLV